MGLICVYPVNHNNGPVPITTVYLFCSLSKFWNISRVAKIYWYKGDETLRQCKTFATISAALVSKLDRKF